MPARNMTLQHPLHRQWAPQCTARKDGQTDGRTDDIMMPIANNTVYQNDRLDPWSSDKPTNRPVVCAIYSPNDNTNNTIHKKYFRRW